jgi:putative membrane protein
MGYWDDGHMDGGWGVFMVLGMVAVWVTLVAAIVLAVVWIARSTGTGSPRGSTGAPGSAEQILAERLARGEIDVEDYRARLAALSSRREG